MPHTILLFEDNQTIRDLVFELLTTEGYTVLRVESLREAQSLVARGGVSLVLADSGESTREGALGAYKRYCEVIGTRSR